MVGEARLSHRSVGLTAMHEPRSDQDTGKSYCLARAAPCFDLRERLYKSPSISCQSKTPLLRQTKPHGHFSATRLDVAISTVVTHPCPLLSIHARSPLYRLSRSAFPSGSFRLTVSRSTVQLPRCHTLFFNDVICATPGSVACQSTISTMQTLEMNRLRVGHWFPNFSVQPIRRDPLLQLTPTHSSFSPGPLTKSHFGVNHNAGVIWDGRSGDNTLETLREPRAQLSDRLLSCPRLLARHTAP